MRLKFIIQFFLFFSIAINVFAQENKFRTFLKNKVKEVENPILYLQKLETKSQLEEAILNDRIGLQFQYLGEMDSALVYHKRSLQSALNFNSNNEEIGIAYNKLGILKYYKGEIDSSAYYLEKALEYLVQELYRCHCYL